tara:strand:- start:849 stop:2390 length:1542 start_codon:yes stop_codon:yes gene_type:complete
LPKRKTFHKRPVPRRAFFFPLDRLWVGQQFSRVRILFTTLFFTFLTGLASAADMGRSVVQVLVYSQTPIWDAPWRNNPVAGSSGTGFVIDGDRVMTNAHVVSWAKQIVLRRFQDPRPWLARVEYISHECDLAVLKVDTPGFFDGLKPLPLGGLPKVQSTVVTCGYPAGGEQISYTRGVVSRIEMQSYVHIGNRAFLSVQTDAAINPGNSGGPVFQGDEVVGVAFMGTPGLENTGFFIPSAVINHFLEDISDGKYDGFPKAGVRIVSLQNPAYRRYLGLPVTGDGARIDSLADYTEKAGLLKKDDVILAVGEHPVGSDGTILLEGNRVYCTTAFQVPQKGEKLKLKIWRDNKEVDVAVPMEVRDDDLNIGNLYDAPPRYFVFAGLVFTPLTLDYVKTFGRNWRGVANSEMIYELYYRRNETPAKVRKEPVVLASTLAHPVNADMRLASRAMVDTINGKRIETLEDVIAAFEENTKPQHMIQFISGTVECLDSTQAELANPEILSTYGIQTDRRL